MKEPNFIIGFTLYGLLIISVCALFYFFHVKESKAERATRIFEDAITAYKNKNLVSLKFQLKILGYPKMYIEVRTQILIELMIITLDKSGEAKVK